MDEFGLLPNLAYTVEGDPRIRTTQRKIARVPLSDYVLETGTDPLLPPPQQTDDSAAAQVLELTGTRIQQRPHWLSD